MVSNNLGKYCLERSINLGNRCSIHLSYGSPWPHSRNWKVPSLFQLLQMLCLWQAIIKGERASGWQLVTFGGESPPSSSGGPPESNAKVRNGKVQASWGVKMPRYGISWKRAGIPEAKRKKRRAESMGPYGCFSCCMPRLQWRAAAFTSTTVNRRANRWWWPVFSGLSGLYAPMQKLIPV